MCAGVLRQDSGQYGQVGLQLSGQQVGRVDDEHAAAVHTEAVRARRANVKLGVQVVFRREFLQLLGQFPALFAAETGIPNHIATGLKPLQRVFQGMDDAPVILFFFIR